MAIVQAGKQFTKDDILRVAGNLAANLQSMLQEANEFRIQLESWPDADLIAMGLAQEQTNAIKGFFVGDLPPIYSAFAASVWVKQLLGTGTSGGPVS